MRREQHISSTIAVGGLSARAVAPTTRMSGNASTFVLRPSSRPSARRPAPGSCASQARARSALTFMPLMTIRCSRAGLLHRHERLVIARRLQLVATKVEDAERRKGRGERGRVGDAAETATAVMPMGLRLSSCSNGSTSGSGVRTAKRPPKRVAPHVSYSPCCRG